MSIPPVFHSVTSGRTSDMLTSFSSPKPLASSAPLLSHRVTPVDGVEELIDYDENPEPLPPIRTPISTTASLNSYDTSVHAALFHSDFYFDVGMLKFLVDDQLFHIHAIFLVRESDIFKQVCSFPRDQIYDAVVLSPTDATAFQFESLVDFFYNGMFNNYNPSWEACVALLAISSRFRMRRVRDFAARAISERKGTRDTVAIINLALEFDVQEWLAPAYAELCWRQKAITAEEGQLLGWEIFAKLTEAREKYLQVRHEETTTKNPSASTEPSTQLSGVAAAVISKDPLGAKSQQRDQALSVVKEIFWPPASDTKPTPSAKTDVVDAPEATISSITGPQKPETLRKKPIKRIH